jgi:hypothetical protein
MRPYNNNIVCRIILILTVTTSALAVPVLVQEKRRQACVDVVQHTTAGDSDVITVSSLGKRTLEEDFDVLWDGWWHYLNVLGESAPPPLPAPNLAGVHVPPPNLNLAEAHVPEVHVPPQGPADSDQESMELADDAPRPSTSTKSESESDPDQGSNQASPHQRSRMRRAQKPQSGKIKLPNFELKGEAL